MRKYFLWIAIALLITSGVAWLQELSQLFKSSIILCAVSVAIGVGAIKALKGYQYTFWILTAVVSGLVYPELFLTVGCVDLRNKWLILIIIQLVMFGMGTQMSIKDFLGIRKAGKGVLIGLLCQFTIMPVLGFIIATTFGFEAEIAAGIVLIGSCSSGLASNVMTYIAKGDLVLSVTITAISTLTAPIMTTFLMKLFASTLIEIDFITMMLQIMKIVIVPLTAAMIHDVLKTYGNKTSKKIYWLALGSVIYIGLVYIMGGFKNPIVEIIVFLNAAIVFGCLYHLVYNMNNKIDEVMPLFSMFGIVYFTLVTTAAGRDNLVQIGLLLVVAAIIHNTAGYVFGYWFSRFVGLDKKQSQTIAFEVGLQNGGMASGLAGAMGKLATVGLASAVFSPWMNISGSVLANYWKKKR